VSTGKLIFSIIGFNTSSFSDKQADTDKLIDIANFAYQF